MVFLKAFQYFFLLRQLYRAPDQAPTPTSPSYNSPAPSAFSPSHPDGQVVIPSSQSWQQSGDSFKPIFKESSSSSHPTASYEKQEKRETPTPSVRAKPSGKTTSKHFFYPQTQSAPLLRNTVPRSHLQSPHVCQSAPR